MTSRDDGVTMRVGARVMSGVAAMTVLAAAPMSAAAQGRVTGVVYDSVAAKPLASALVQMALVSDPRVSRSVRADDRGRFRVDSVSAGTWVVAVLHPRIDSLGIEQLVRPLTVSGAGELKANLAIPAARSLVRQVCGDSVSGEGSGYLHGRLRGLHAGTAGTGSVDVQWIDMLVSVTKGVGVTRVPRQLSTAVQPDGTYTLCGVPADGTVRVRGLLDSTTTGSIELVMPPEGIARVDLAVGAVSLVDVDSVPMRRGQGVLRGRVLGPQGQPLPNASVMVWGSGLTTRSDSTGLWQLRQLPTGTHMVETRAIGFGSDRQIVDIGDPAVHDLHSTLARMVTLDTVRTRALRETLFEPTIRAFEKRRQVGLGTFRGPADLDRIMPFEAAHLFSSIPGMRIVPTMKSSLSMGNMILMRGGSSGVPCVPDLMVDRMRINSDVHEGFIDNWVLFTQVRAVEVYQSLALTPPEFARAGNQCGTIVIWTGR